MGWTTDDIPRQDGRVAVVTGGNGGLGLETVRPLAAKGAHVVMAARNLDKARDAVEDVLATAPGASVEVVPLDLASLASVRKAADEVLANHDRIDVLVNNAGMMATPERRTEDGFEFQLGVNHFGHWALTAHLLPALLRAEAARVVTVSSTAHHMGRPLDPDDLEMRDYDPWRAYGRSKLANFHFGLGLDRRLREAGAAARSYVAHPGLTNSDLQATTVAEQGGGDEGTPDLGAKVSHWLTERTGMSSAEGALSQLRAATDPSADGGTFWGPLWGNFGPPVRKPVLRPNLDRDIAVLWEVSEQATGVPIDVDAARGA